MEIPHAINLAKMAEIHGVSTKTIKVWMATGKLLKPSIRQGKVCIWYREHWESWKETRRRKMSWAT
jgi:predicted site-specific integrase-resolvase